MSLIERSDPQSMTSTDIRRWVAAFLIAGAALLGVLILAAILAFALNPPTWLQVVLGLVLVAGAVGLAWLVFSALSSPRR
jgi:hypothetical protein